MKTREIPREQWADFFDEFSRQHEGWLATLELLGAEIGAQKEARDLPFVGISADWKAGGRDNVSIILGEKRQDHVTHTIAAPLHVRLEETESGAHQALQIESAGGEQALIRFRSAVLPEMVDGVILEPARGIARHGKGKGS
jgi:uncharacterized protein DUF5335